MNSVKGDIFAHLPGIGRVTILDLGARPADEPPFYIDATRYDCCVIGVDCDRGVEEGFRAQFAANVDCHFLPAMLGSGSEVAFYECSRTSVSSTFRPSRFLSEQFDGLTEATEVQSVRSVGTVGLSDLLPDCDADLIKSDLQGADLSVLRSGSRLLERAIQVVVEVEFIQQFMESPRFWEVAKALEGWGFMFHSFVDFGTRPLKGFDPTWSAGRRGYRQWLWGNAVFVPIFERWAVLEDHKILRLGLLMHSILHCYDYGWKMLDIFDSRHGTDFATQYVDVISQGGEGVL